MIYIMRTMGGIENFFKVGFTKSEDSVLRKQKNQTGCPLRLIIVKEMEGTEKDEARLHKELAKHRSWGEWFYDNQETRKILGIDISSPIIGKCLAPSKPIKDILEELFDCNPGVKNPTALPISFLIEKYGFTEEEIRMNSFNFFIIEATGKKLESLVRRVYCHENEMDKVQKFLVPRTMVGRTGSTFSTRAIIDGRI